jgi:WD40 repeat protein
MDAERYARCSEILDAVRKLHENDREAYVEKACGADRVLLAEVKSLLGYAGDEVGTEDAFAEQQIGGNKDLLFRLLDQPQHPEHIGPYRILRVLGEGGMGIVFEAEQDSPRRRIALKILRPAMAGADRLRRFKQEAEILGRLQHPGIAQIFEAGSFDLGHGEQPYLAMELVEGLELRKYVDQKGLDLRQQLALLADIGDAVQHAHERGVIHRDLKPENVLVDERGSAKVLDFGIARAQDTSTVLTTMATSGGQLLGTLAYMSPEQFEAKPDAVTPRTDIYALGVIGFELLTGRLPFEVAGLSISQAVRVVHQHGTPRVRDLKPSTPSDVETIVGKALEKEPARRYESAAMLAADLRRFLEHQPIVARPPSQLYLARRFARRNLGLVLGVGIAMLALLAGLGAALRFAFDADQQRREALHSQMKMAGAQLTSLKTYLPEDPIGAWALLNGIPEHIRGWEWNLSANGLPRSLGGSQPRTGWRGKAGHQIGEFVQIEGQERVVALVDTQLRVWDLDGESLPAPVPQLEVVAMGCASRGSFVAVATVADGMVLVDLADESETTLLPRLDRAPVHVALTQDARTVAWCDSQAFSVWDERGLWVQDYLDDLDVPPEVVPNRVSVIGETLVCDLFWRSGPRAFRFLVLSFDLATRTELARIESKVPYTDLVLNAEGNQVVFPEPEGFGVYDLPLLERVGSWTVPEGVISSVAFSADGSRYACSSKERGVHVFDTANSQQLAAFSHTMSPTADDGGDVRCSLDGRTLLVTGPRRRRLYLVDTERTSTTTPLLEMRGHAAWVYNLALSQDGGLLASIGPKETHLHVWDVRSGAEIASLENKVKSVSTLLAFSPDDSKLIASATGVATPIHSWDLRTGRYTGHEVTHPEKPKVYNFLPVLGEAGHARLSSRDWVLPDGQVIVSAEGSGHDSGTLSFTHRVGGRAPTPPLEKAYGIGVDRDGRWLACGTSDSVLVYGLGSGELVATLKVGSLPYCLAFSPDRTRLAAGLQDGRVILVETSFFETVLTYQAHDTPAADETYVYVHALAWTPDGTRLITASGDWTIRVWSAESPADAKRRQREHEADVVGATQRLEELIAELEEIEAAADALLKEWNATAAKRAAARVALVTRWGRESDTEK